MKNLKKSLALVLALVMVFSLVVFANAKFADEDAISPKFADACGVMNGLGILKGDENGVFNPQGTLTRGQAMKIVTYLKLGSAADSLKATSAPFNDVPATAWEAPFVAYCKNAKITNGYGDGNFGKDDELSGYAFAKFLLVALGYGAADEYVGDDWKIAVAADALTTGLFKGIEGYLSDAPLPREVAAQLAFNAAQIQPVQYVKLLEMYNAAGAPLCETVLDFQPTPVADVDEEGRPVKDYVNQAGTKVIYEAASEPLAVITDGSFDTTKAPYSKWDFSAANTYWNKDDGYYVSSYEKVPGATIEFYGYVKNGTTYITAIVGTYYSFVTVKAVDANAKKVTVTYKGTDYDYTEATTPDSYKILSAFAKGDALCVVWDYTTSTDDVFSAEKAEEVAGEKITAKNAAGFTLDGKNYKYDDDYASGEPALGAVDGKFYLDPNGYVLGFVGNTAAPEVHTYVYAVKEFSKTSGGGVDEYGSPIPTVTAYFVQCVNEAGEAVNYQTADNTYGGFSGKGVYEVKTAYNSTLKVDVATFTKGATEKTENTTIKATDKKTAGGTYFDTAVKFIFVDKELAQIKIVVKDGIQAISTAKDIYYHAASAGGSNLKASVIYVAGAPEAAPEPIVGIAFIYGDTASGNSALVTNGKGQEVTGWAKTIYVDGVKKDIYVAAKDAIANGYYTVKEDGGLTILTAKTDATLKAPTAVTNNAMGYISTADVTDLAYASATVVNLTKDPTFADASKLTTANEVAIVLNAKGEIAIIYVVK